MSDEEEKFETQKSQAISAADETSAAAVTSGEASEKTKNKSHKYVTRNSSRRLELVDMSKYVKPAATYKTGAKAGTKIKWERSNRIKRLARFGVGRGSVGTVVVRCRVVKNLKEIRDSSLADLSFLFRRDKKNPEQPSRMTFQAGAVDACVRSGDIFIHDRMLDAKVAATDKYGKTHTITEYDARRAWAIASGDGGRHAADIPYTAKGGPNPVHRPKKEEAAGEEKPKKTRAKRAKASENE